MGVSGSNFLACLSCMDSVWWASISASQSASIQRMRGPTAIGAMRGTPRAQMSRRWLTTIPPSGSTKSLRRRMSTGEPSGRYNRAEARQSKSQFDEAIADFTQAIRLDPKHVSSYLGRGSAWVLIYSEKLLIVLLGPRSHSDGRCR
jgi:hypothetical protein